MPRPKVGDIRATALRPSSDPGDALELSQRFLPIEPESHTLMHGHGARTTHGSALYNPYGKAHDAHLRTHDIRSGHEASTTRGLDASNGYIYPVPPISYDQEQNFGARSEPSPAWPNSERLSQDDVNNMLATYDQQAQSEYQSDIFGANIGSVDVSAWLREMMASGMNPSPTEPDILNAQQPSSSIPFTDPQALPVPQALDVSHDLAQAQDPDYARQFDLLPRLGNLDFNDNYLSGSEQDVGDVNGLRSAAGMFDSELFNLPMTEAPSVQETREYGLDVASSNQFSTSAPPPPMLTVQGCGNGDFRYTSSSTSAIAEPKPQQYAFEYLLDGDFVICPPAGLPPLTRSSSIGSHSSGRSRSSMGMSHWARNGSSDCVNATAGMSDQWNNSAENMSIATANTAENPWNLAALPLTAEWPMTRVQALMMQERGRAPPPAMLRLQVAKDGNTTTDVRTMSFN